MKSRTSTCVVAILFAANEPSVAQSASTTLPLKGLLSQPLSSGASTRSSATPISEAKVYDFATADYPGAAFSLAFGNNARTVVGAFVFAPGSSSVNSFTFKRGVYRTLVVPGATGSFATDINSADRLVGAYADPAGTVHGFLDVEGAFSNIDFPGAEHTQAIGLNDSTEIVGDYIVGAAEHGFLYSSGVYTAIDLSRRPVHRSDQHQLGGRHRGGMGGFHHRARVHAARRRLQLHRLSTRPGDDRLGHQ